MGGGVDFLQLLDRTKKRDRLIILLTKSFRCGIDLGSYENVQVEGEGADCGVSLRDPSSGRRHAFG